MSSDENCARRRLVVVTTLPRSPPRVDLECVGVQLRRGRARLLHRTRPAQPRTLGRAVERGADGHGAHRAQAPDALVVLSGPQTELVELGQVRERLAVVRAGQSFASNVLSSSECATIELAPASRQRRTDSRSSTSADAPTISGWRAPVPGNSSRRPSHQPLVATVSCALVPTASRSSTLQRSLISRSVCATRP